MIMLFRLFIALSIPVLLGYFVFSWFFKKLRLPAYYSLFLFYGLGLGLIALEMFFMSILGMNFSLFNILLPGFLIFLPIFLFNKAIGKPVIFVNPLNTWRSFNHWERILFFIFGLEVIYFFWGALITPMIYWDNWAIWGYKAKLFFHHKAIPLEYFLNREVAFTHQDYPLGIPLMETWVYLCLGYWNDQLVKILFPLFTLGIAVSIYYALRKSANRIISLSPAVFMLATPHVLFFGGSGYADLPLAFYNTVAVLSVYRWLEIRDSNLLVLAGIFSGLGCWIKNEGIVLALINAVSLYIILLLNKKFNPSTTLRIDGERSSTSLGTSRTIKPKPVIIYALIFFMIFLPWFIFCRSLGLPNDVINKTNLSPQQLFNNLDRLKVIFTEAMDKTLNLETWSIFWIYFIIALIMNINAIFKNYLNFIILSIGLFLSAAVCIYIISPYDIYWHIGTTFDRILLVLMPSAVFITTKALARE